MIQSMQRRRALIRISQAAAALALLPGGVCAHRAGKVDVSLAAAAPFIDRANAEWLVAIRSGDAEALCRPYADDALFILADGATSRGHAAICALYAARARTGAKVIDASISDDGRTAAGADDVYEWGRASMVVREASGQISHTGGRFLTVWRRFPDEQWQIVRNLVF